MRATILLCLVILSGAANFAQGKDDWWKNMLLYQIYPRSFQDSDGDGIGDLKGIMSRLDHLVEANVDAFWISPFYLSPMVDFGYDISDYLSIDPIYGTMQDFEDLIKLAHSKNLKVIIDFIPNHTSDQHGWFKLSLTDVQPYSDYYVWHPGKLLPNGTSVIPNNWISLFSGSAWSWNDQRNAFYLHQYTKEQPDLNYRNPNVVRDIKGIMRYWLNKGIDGFRMDAVYHIVEDNQYRDEPPSGITNDPNQYLYTFKNYTQDQQGSYDVLQDWRNLLEEYNTTKVMMIEAYSNTTLTIKYYDYGAHFPFNFRMITDVNKNSTAADFKNMIDQWMEQMPLGHTANWVAGNHDNSRVRTRFGSRSRAVTLMTLLLPGVGVTYYGDEIGMDDTYISWKDTVDPEGCNAGEDNYQSMSRDPERTPFQWDNSTSAGFSTNPHTWLPVNPNYHSLNLAAQKKQKDSYFNFYKAISKLRRSDAFKTGNLVTKLLSDNVLAFVRETGDRGSIYAVMNMGNTTERVNLSAFSQERELLKLYYTSGTKFIPKLISTKRKLRIPPSGLAVFVTMNFK